MYVRWKRQRRRDVKRWDGGRGANMLLEEQWLLSAWVVASHRVDGAPRQRTLAYLGSIREGRLTDAGWAALFWASADRKLGALNLPDPQRETLEARLTERVVRPSDADVARSIAELDARISMAMAGGR